MVRYFYDFLPLYFIGALCILALPWLGLIALFVVVLVVLPAVTWAIVYVPYKLVTTVGHHLHGHADAAAVSPGHTS